MQIDPISSGSCDVVDDFDNECANESVRSSISFAKDTLSSCEELRLSLPVMSWGWLNPVTWVKAAGNGLSKAFHAIDYYGNYAVSSNFREEVKRAEKVSMEMQHSHLVYSENDLFSAQERIRAELATFDEKAAPHIRATVRDTLTGAGIILSAPTNPFGVVYGSLGVFQLVGALKHLEVLGEEIGPFCSAMNEYRSMMEANNNASYDRCVEIGYSPNLAFHPNPTRLGNSFIDLNAGPSGVEINVGWGINFIFSNPTSSLISDLDSLPICQAVYQ